MIAQGQSFDYTLTGSVREFVVSGYSAADLRADVLSKFDDSGLVVKDLQLRTDESFFATTWNYRAAVRVTTGVAFAREADVRATVAGAFWQAADQRPVITPGRNSQSDNIDAPTNWVTPLALAAVIAVVVLVIAVKAG